MKEITAKVVSNKMLKTVVVVVERQVKHPLYGKIMKKTKNFKADSGNLSLNIGDMVKIISVRPLSRDKHYKVVKKI